jgi:hypothetical protein
VSCVLCAVYCVLCAVCCVICVCFAVLCAVCYVALLKAGLGENSAPEVNARVLSTRTGLLVAEGVMLLCLCLDSVLRSAVEGVLKIVNGQTVCVPHKSLCLSYADLALRCSLCVDMCTVASVCVKAQQIIIALVALPNCRPRAFNSRAFNTLTRLT